ncbi:MAG: alginate export family protein [Hyphomonadaceae bacterium]
MREVTFSRRARWGAATVFIWALAAGGACAQGAAGPAANAPAPVSDSLSDAIGAGRLLLEARARYEFVDQANRVHDAGAATLRTRLGWETNSWRDLKALIEFENVSQIGGYDYYDGVHPHGGAPAPNGGYPQVSDPESTELNRLQVVWSPSPAFQATLGRQRIVLDDQRFVGNTGWRQDEVTFDAARLDWRSGKFRATYAYLAEVNRFLAEAQDWDSDSHLLNAAYAFAEPFTLTGFAYWLDLKQSPANSRATYGLRASGRTRMASVGLNYALTYATQEEYGANPAQIALDYWGGEVSGQFDIVTLRVAYESLEGDGVRGFSTPLGTLHAFQGWADLFLTTPADGIEDVNFQINVKPRFWSDRISGLDLTARWHAFAFERTGADIGAEFDAQAMVAINRHVTIGIKYADFQSDIPAAFPDTAKGWFTLEYRY